MSKWIKFITYPPNKGRKMPSFLIRNKESDFVLGEIKWYGPFRQYSFFPEPNTVFEKTCLKDITDFIVELMEKHKSQRECGTGQ